ncbi:MAG TPA: phosphate/phosphite/phosphonate ABC transporter substrate-binding protein [Paucimonas sp.]|nr:phosphate/phosphite/phosphonate ABC transporter substrate-binding protein [Paucimonas sp.]
MSAKTWAAGIMLAVSTAATAQDNCPNRGDLDAPYCDADKDLVADAPTDPKKFKNPATLAFTFTPLEDAGVYEKLFKPFTEHLAQCTGKKVSFLPVQTNSAEIEAMRAGKLHVGAFSAGPTNFAVNIAGAVPFAVVGNQKEFQSYSLIVITRKDGAIQKMADIKGKKVAHTSATSNSGHLAPMALFPKVGVVPDKDYKILFSGKHDHSILGVNSGEYDAAAVASDVFERMAERGQVKADDFRIIYRSDKFPTQSFAHAHDLDPALRDQMLKCFYDYRFTDDLKKAFAGADRFFPINYKKDFFMVRYVSQAAGESFNRAAYDKQAAKEKK